MPSCQQDEPGAGFRRPFLVAPYVAEASGEWLPSVLPTTCPDGASDEPCHIILDHRRHRKTGPCVPVSVLECTTHDCHFTLYPSGHVPYGRAAVAPVGLDGAVLKAPATKEAPAETAQPKASDDSTPWRLTRFAAVVDAADGKAWARDDGGGGPSWKTQLHRLDELAQLLGLEPELPAAAGERIAQLLDLPRLNLIDEAKQLAQVIGFKARGALLIAILKLASMGGVLERILACGALVGLWPPVHLWHSTDSGPRRTVFPGRGIAAG